MSTKKYEILDNSYITKDGFTVYQIKALVDIPSNVTVPIKAGTLGGFIQSEDHLSQDGNCWVYYAPTQSGAVWGLVYDKARVQDNAVIFPNGIVRGSAIIKDNAVIGGGESTVEGDAVIGGFTKMGAPTTVATGNFTGNMTLWGKGQIS